MYLASRNVQEFPEKNNRVQVVQQRSFGRSGFPACYSRSVAYSPQSEGSLAQMVALHIHGSGCVVAVAGTFSA
jgi:hypothetical protein